MELNGNKEQMLKLASYRMPFGKHKGMRLVDLPEPYVVWFHNKGLPSGELGQMLGVVYEIKVNGLEHLFKDLGNSKAAQNKTKPKRKAYQFE